MRDDPLREASDPTTSPERLVTLLASAESLAVAEAVMRHARLPLPLLRRRLRVAPLASNPFALHCAAWHNPVVPLLLWSDPLPDYESGALSVLQRLGGFEGLWAPVHAGTLAESIALLACHRAPVSRARDFARHLADLFGLPWPGP